MRILRFWRRLIPGLLIAVLATGLIMPIQAAFADSTNLIANPSVEISTGSLPSSWTPNSWGNNTANLSYVNNGHGGNFSLITTLKNRVGGDAKWIPDAVNVAGGQSYTYSDYYMSDVDTEIDAQYTDVNGNVSYVYLAGVPASATWATTTKTFMIPANVAKVSILHILATNGTLQTDDFSLMSNAAPTSPPVIPPPTTDGNLIANPSFETVDGSGPADWYEGGWGSNTTSFSYPTTDGHTGARSAKVQTTNYSSGDAKWYFKPVAVQSNTTYDYADYYKSTIASTLVAQYTDSSGAMSYQALGSENATANWKQASASFTPPANTKYVTIFHLINGVGALQIDDASLVATSATPPPPPQPSDSNIVPNPSMETPDPSNAKKPQYWHSGSWGTNTKSFAYLNSGHSGNRSVKATISSYSSGAAYWIFDSQPIIGGNMYDFSDYYESNVGCGIDATINMKDGSTQYLHLGESSPSAKSWTEFRTQFIAPAGAESINIVHNIYGVGWLTVDDFSLKPFSYQGFNRPIVSITDDDGYSSYYTNGLPILQKYGLTATDYIITGDLNNDPAYMTSAMVKKLHDAGHEIGSHTVTHPDLTTLGATKMDNELKNSQATLQKILGLPVTNFASPYGTYNQQVITDADKYYQSYRGVQAGYNSKNNFDPTRLMVQNILVTTTTADIQGWLAEAKATNTWLILVYHKVDYDPSAGDYNTYPSDFDAQMSAVKSSGIAVETVSQALAEIQPQL